MYVDALFSRDNDRIYIVERDKNGNRIYKDFSAEYVFYYNDIRGKHKTIFNTPVSRFSSRSNKEFRRELKMHDPSTIWESDFNPVFRCLENNYLGTESPKLHTAFFDLEVAWHNEFGWAPTTDPFNNITAISVYLDWLDKLVTLVMPPPSMTEEDARKISDMFDDCYLFTDEVDMLNTFLDLIDDADILSGWNSEGFDIPYTVNRIARVMSKDDTRRMCLWNQYPKPREYERYGKTEHTYDTVGRVHLDYLQLYQKYTYEERHSYSLDAIGEYELDERKTAYEGTLDQLYNRDFHKFIEYNRQDTRLLAKLDDKLKFIDLANEIAHDNTVLLQTTMGAVATSEQAIINDAHGKGLVVPNRKQKIEGQTSVEEKAAGAYVAHPKKGIHDWVGSVDINSLYPSAIRALNMGPETIVGQLKPVYTEEYIYEKMHHSGRKVSFAAAWEGLFGTLEYTYLMAKDKSKMLTVEWENGAENTVMRADELYDVIFNSGNKWVISANGTIFSYERKGIIPGLLEFWYAERKRLQAILKQYKDLKSGIDISSLRMDDDFLSELNKSVHVDHRVDVNFSELNSAISENDLPRLSQLIFDNHLIIKDGKITANFDIDDCIEYWDKKQHVKKIALNSVYGSLLNAGCRFNDHRIGQSTTLTGRTIVQHQSAHANLQLAGSYDYIGDAVIYGDTDSVIGSTVINTSKGKMTIEEFFLQADDFSSVDDKEYAYDAEVMVMSYDPSVNQPYMGHIDSIYRHKVSKALYEIEDEFGNVVTVTEDHSVMVERDGLLIEVKPMDIQDDDFLISIVEK